MKYWTILLMIPALAACSGGEGMDTQGLGGAPASGGKTSLGRPGSGGDVAPGGADSGGGAGAGDMGGTGGAQEVTCEQPNRLDIPTEVVWTVPGTCVSGTCTATINPAWSVVQADEEGLLWEVTNEGTAVSADGQAETGNLKIFMSYGPHPNLVGNFLVRLDPETWDVAEVSMPDLVTWFSEPTEGGAGSTMVEAPPFKSGWVSLHYRAADAIWASLFDASGFCL